MDSALDFVDDNAQADAETNDSTSREERKGLGKLDMPPRPTKPTKQRHLKAKSVSSPQSSLEILDACLPVEPNPKGAKGLPVPAGVAPGGVVSKDATDGTVDSPGLSQWLRNALYGSGADSNASLAASTTTTALSARIIPLAHRMRSLLLRRRDNTIE